MNSIRCALLQLATLVAALDLSAQELQVTVIPGRKFVQEKLLRG
jgi:hypothetical protein